MIHIIIRDLRSRRTLDLPALAYANGVLRKTSTIMGGETHAVVGAWHAKPEKSPKKIVFNGVLV
jgi:hypothetical protein